MGEALLGGLIDAGWESTDLAVAEPDAERRRALEQAFPDVRVVPSAAWAVADAAVVVIAVKPDHVHEVLEAVAPVLDRDAMVLSIAAGVTLDTLQSGLPGRAVVRAMPNTPALVREGAAAIAGGAEATDAHLELAERVLGAVGVVVRVPESLLDAVTGLSGSGPAYLFLVAEALIEAGVLAGIPRATAVTLVEQTLYGSAKLLAEGSESPAELRAAVTSPGGTTASGLQVLEARGVRAAFLDAVQAASARSRALGRPEE